MCIKTVVNHKEKQKNKKKAPIHDDSPEMSASFLSRTFYTWAQPLFSRASRLHSENKLLKLNDLLHLASIDDSNVLSTVFEEAWKKQVLIEEEERAKTTKHNKSKKKASSPLMKAIQAVIGRRLLYAGFSKVSHTFLLFTFPILISAILKFIEETQSRSILVEEQGGGGESTPWYVMYKGYWLSALLFVAMDLISITYITYKHKLTRSGYQTRVAVSVAVYNKALRLAPSENNNKTLGELINLMQVDASKIERFILHIHELWDSVLQITGYMVILYMLIGWPCFAGLVVMILAGPVQGMIAKRLFGLNRHMVKYTDQRVKNTNEAVQGIRCVKMHTWEDYMLKKIGISRDKELKFLEKIAYLRGFSLAYMGALPGSVAVSTFAMYALVYKGAVINASTLFAALVSFNQLRFPLLFYPICLAQYAQAKVSAKRVENFLRLKEVVYDDYTHKNSLYRKGHVSLKRGEVMLKNVTVFWSNPDTPAVKRDGEDNNDQENTATPELYPKSILSDITLNVVPGELCAIVGRVGSGKSTLCSAILNETIIRGESIGLNGTVAYAAQSPWIFNATLRNNILFGQPFQQLKYDNIIKTCQLTHDLALLDFGDMTEIGENGINLSGGQRQRVSIARAAYSEADIIVLDDPLSALDPEVGKKLFDQCIVQLMKDKTRILVTNQLQCLKYCDSVVALGEGRVIEQGTFDDLSNKDDGEVKRLLEDLRATKIGPDSETSSSIQDVSTARPRRGSNASSIMSKKRGESMSEEVVSNKKTLTNNGNTGIVTREERNVGAVSWQVYKKYIQSGGGFARFILTYFMFILCTANIFVSNGWIALWSADAKYEKNTLLFYLGFYALFSLTLGIFIFFRAYFLAKLGVHASGTLHKNLLCSVLNAPMSFFDTTPTGRILSRFSKDLYAIDLEMSEHLDFFLISSLTVVVSLVTISVVTPWFGIATLPFIFIYFKVLSYFREVSRETKRLDSISRSPVYAHFSETLGGLGTIRAYDQANRFISEFEQKVNANTRTYYNIQIANRWLSVRLELLGAVIAGLAAVFASHAVIKNAASGTSGNFASIAGLSLTYAVSLTVWINHSVRSFAQMEASMNAVERILFYTDNIPQEAPSNVKELEQLSRDSLDDNNKPLIPALVAVKIKGAENLNSSWPSNGDIDLKDLKMRYRPESPLVIKGLNVHINGGERVGVVGRTGSGKSSLLLTLLRIVEPALLENDENYESPIVIDGIDVLRVGLKDLRSKIGIIPQNPVLFSGTIRTNMDPFGQCTNDDIWNALERCGMKEAISAMPELLDAPVAEYGENLSQGQRQLLCLGCALLKRCRILFLDEATSSVDYETDANIQRTLRDDFAGCTVLTIAHRVNTIMDSDKILVMMDGKVGEFASPKQLLTDESSIFYDIVKQSRSEQEHCLLVSRTASIKLKWGS